MSPDRIASGSRAGRGWGCLWGRGCIAIHPYKRQRPTRGSALQEAAPYKRQRPTRGSALQEAAPYKRQRPTRGSALQEAAPYKRQRPARGSALQEAALQFDRGAGFVYVYSLGCCAVERGRLRQCVRVSDPPVVAVGGHAPCGFHIISWRGNA
jgi:hypothetical protein